MRRECRERFPRHRGLAVSFEVGDGGKRSRHSHRMRNLQFYVSGKRPIALVFIDDVSIDDTLIKTSEYLIVFWQE